MNRRISKEWSESLSEQEVRLIVKDRLEGRIKQLPHAFWRCASGKEHSRIAIRYLIEEHLKLELKEVPKKISAKTFLKAGLFRILVEFFDRSYFKALDFAYPGVFKPWEFSKGMNKIWDGEEGRDRSIEAIKSMIESMGISIEEIPANINYQKFKEYGLGGMLQILYNSSPFEAINALFPGTFKPWQFHVKNYWRNESIETAREATKWLVEEKLGLSSKEIDKARRKHFLKLGLGQMLKQFYGNSHINALADTYPLWASQKSQL